MDRDEKLIEAPQPQPHPLRATALRALKEFAARRSVKQSENVSRGSRRRVERSVGEQRVVMGEPSQSVETTQAESVADWMERLKRKGIQAMVDEFNAIKAERLRGSTANFEQNMHLNRYGNIPLLDDTRVVLKDDLPQTYIHANYVDGFNRPRGYIICQAPVPTSINDYWRMVWQERITLIVCLASLKERGFPKADLFFPPEMARPYRAGPFRIIAESVNPVPGHKRVTLAHLRLRCWFAKRGTPDRIVVMLYYGNWPDTAVPQDTAQFLKFVRLVKTFESWAERRAPPGDSHPPALVHCSAGVGRSATLVACRIAIEQLEATDQIDIPGLVRRLRRFRAMAVQNVLQYIFINLLVGEAVRQRRGGSA